MHDKLKVQPLMPQMSMLVRDNTKSGGFCQAMLHTRACVRYRPVRTGETRPRPIRQSSTSLNTWMSSAVT